MGEQDATQDGLDSLSLGHRAQIGRIQSALFGGPVAPVEVGGFAIARTIGAGAFGVVYEARDPKLSRTVAIKVLSAGDEASQDKLLREATMMATVGHPNVATVYEVGTFQGRGGRRVFVAMEFVEGPTLRTHLQQAQLSVAQTVALMVQAGRGLQAAHDAGVVHRDFKPDNVLVGADGRVRVVDFGLASTIADAQAFDDVPVDPTSEATATRGPAGTPAYMAPEVFTGSPTDARADQFSYCVTLFEAVYGCRPFSGGSVPELVSNLVANRRRDPPRKPVPPTVRKVLARGLSIDPTARYPSMAALLADLDVRPAGLKRALILAGVAAAGGVAIGVSLVRGRSEAIPPCAIEPSAVTQLLNEDRLAAASRAFAAAAPGFGADAWARTRQRLGDYAEAWRSAAVESCGRERTTEESQRLRSLEAHCLSSARDTVDAVVTRLASATRDAVVQGPRLVRTMRRPAECTDAVTLLATLPTDAEAREEAARIAGMVDDARALEALSRFEDARTKIEQAQAAADALGFDPTRASTLVARAHLELKAGNPTECRARAREGFDLAVSAGDRRTAGVAALALAESGVADAAYAESAAEWLATGERLRDEIGDAPMLAGGLALARATLATQGSDTAAAQRALVAAQTVLSADDETHPTLPVLLGNWAGWLMRRGKFAEAITKLEAALALVERNSGPQHPDAAWVHFNLGSAAMSLARNEDARRSLARALQLYGSTDSLGHPNAIQARVHLGVMAYSEGDHAGAIEHFEEGLRIADAQQPPNGALIGETCLRFADLLSAAGQHARAAAMVERATTLLGAVAPEGDPRMAVVFGVAMVVAKRAGKPAEALVAADRALSLLSAGGDLNPMAVNVLHESGVILLDAGRTPEAITRLDRAAAALAGGVEDPRRAARVDFDRARALVTTDPARARRLAESALANLSSDTPTDYRERVQRWIAAH